MTRLVDVLAAAKRQAKDHEACLRGGHASQRCADADLLARAWLELFTADGCRFAAIEVDEGIDVRVASRLTAEGARALAADLLRAAAELEP